ncbi:beta-defensin 40 [Rattus norvegicus]|uniref:Beta-defensin 40 n=2 Tax=Rattus norvegicus TaxID=10116 RepID=A6IWB0_RAT|nr:beta-defensin 40 precursor [Rattus norvegicus]AAT51906.1 beta-defensin 40 [Rattus norvegicus]EDM08962.1 beta-defensin 40 [Rattus norvegicus]|eukprot:NP_001032600.1 beta-defensin 40 precursor [Rattus norvegicus]
MKISCFLMLVLFLSCFQMNSGAGLDTMKCVRGKNNCHMHRCPWFFVLISTCYSGKGSCCQKRRWFTRSHVNNV